MRQLISTNVRFSSMFTCTKKLVNLELSLAHKEQVNTMCEPLECCSTFTESSNLSCYKDFWGVKSVFMSMLVAPTERFSNFVLYRDDMGKHNKKRNEARGLVFVM